MCEYRKILLEILQVGIRKINYLLQLRKTLKTDLGYINLFLMAIK